MSDKPISREIIDIAEDIDPNDLDKIRKIALETIGPGFKIKTMKREGNNISFEFEPESQYKEEQ